MVFILVVFAISKPAPGTMERNSVFDRKFSDSLLR